MKKNNRCTRGLIIGIDASNLREGGGVTHLSEMLRNSKMEEFAIHKVIVWGGKKTLETLKDRSWLSKKLSPEIDSGWFSRICWQKYILEPDDCRLLRFAATSGSGPNTNGAC